MRARRWVSWGLLLYLGATSAWYLRVAFAAGNALPTPKVVIGATLAAALGLSLGLVRRAWMAATWCGALAAAGLALVVLSRQVPAAAIALWLLALAWAWADWLLRRSRALGASASRYGCGAPPRSGFALPSGPRARVGRPARSR